MFSLSTFLEKRGIKTEEDLSPEEKSVVSHYKVVLSKGEVSVDSIKEFCKHQISVLESNFDGKNPITPIQQACLHVYLNILRAIEGPQAEREALERHLNQIIQES